MYICYTIRCENQFETHARFWIMFTEFLPDSTEAADFWPSNREFPRAGGMNKLIVV